MRLTFKYKDCPNSLKGVSSIAVKNALTFVLLVMLATFWGCSRSADNKQASSNDNQAPSTQSSPEAGSVPNTSGGAPAAPAAVVIATADGEKAGTRVEITELKRLSDNTLNLKFALVNDTSDRHSFSYDYGDRQYSTIDFNTVGGVNLVDGANRKKYFVVRDSENNCLCSRGLKDIPPNSRGNLWVKFPAPPDDVQKISIVIPHFGPIDDVPISR